MPRRLSEDATRKQMIDPQLEQAGWYLRGMGRALLAKTEELGVVQLVGWRGYSRANSKHL